MRKFAIKFLIFISPLLLLFVWWERELARIPNNDSEKVRRFEQAAPDCEVLVLGSSYAYLGINPDFFTKKGFNMSNYSQRLYYDTEMTIRYLPHLPKLKYAVFTVGYLSFEADMLARSSKESFRCPFYYRFYRLPAERWIDNFNSRNFSMVALYGLPDSVRYLKQGFRVNLDRRQANNGWCDESIDQNPETRNINDEKGKRRADYYTSIMKEANIAYNRGLLLKAIRLCQHASVVPVLVTTPVYYTFRVHMDLQKYERMQEIVHSLGNESGAKYFNHLDDQRFDIDDFYDDDHLNGRGAEKFSKILDKEALQ